MPQRHTAGRMLASTPTSAWQCYFLTILLLYRVQQHLARAKTSARLPLFIKDLCYNQCWIYYVAMKGGIRYADPAKQGSQPPPAQPRYRTLTRCRAIGLCPTSPHGPAPAARPHAGNSAAPPPTAGNSPPTPQAGRAGHGGRRAGAVWHHHGAAAQKHEG